MLVKLVQPLNASSPMLVTLFGTTTLVSLSQFLKAELATQTVSFFMWVGIPRGEKDTLRPHWGGNPLHVNGYPKKYSKVGVKKYSKSFASMYGIMLDGGTQYEDGRQRIKPHNFIIKADQGERVTRRMLDNFNKAFEDMQNGKTPS